MTPRPWLRPSTTHLPSAAPTTTRWPTTHQRARDKDTLSIYELTCEFAKLEPPPPEMQQLIAAMQGNQEAMDGFVSGMAGTLPAPEFFGPENAHR